jgi:hypothetical protein
MIKVVITCPATIEEVFVGGKIFSSIKSDDRVTSQLDVCLYCEVKQSGNDNGSNWHKDIYYKIPLRCVDNHSHIKQCPACKTIYILSDPTK